MVRTTLGWATAATLATVAAACDRSSSPNGTPGPTAAPPPRVADQPPQPWRATTRPGTFDPGDLLDVRVYGIAGPGMATDLYARVQADGTVGLPYVGDVAAAGRDRSAVARAVADAFRNANVMADAVVTVRRLQVAGTGGPTPGPVGPFDLVRCTVGNLTAAGSETVLVERIDGQGRLDVPLVGPVAVAGLTDGRAAAAVAKVYREADIEAAAPVSVLVLERAPADAAGKSLPDGPVEPVPPSLRDLYQGR